MVADKQFDPVEGSRQRARSYIDMLDRVAGLAFSDCNSRHELAAAVRQASADLVGLPDWYPRWFDLFSKMAGTRREPASLSVADVQLIQSVQPMIGWTVSNLIRAVGHERNVAEQLRAIYAALQDNSTDTAATTRWRIAHALGRLPEEANIALLLEIVDGDSHVWARYGAVRSLIELAVYAQPAQRRDVLAALGSRLVRLQGEPLTQLTWATRHDEAPLEWADDVLPLIREAVRLAGTGSEREVWLRRQRDFESWARRREVRREGPGPA
jgi:hypothetical protein